MSSRGLAAVSGRVRRVGLALLVTGMVAGALSAALEVPFLASRVNDLAGLLSPDSAARVERTLSELEEKTGSQVAVLTIPSLEGDSLEGYSLRVAETWKLGRGEFDDGALLLIARDDRKMRLEVGYGLEPILTDAISGRILDSVLRPKFREGDFQGGIENASQVISDLLQGQDSLPPPGSSPPTQIGERLAGGAIFLVVVGTFSLLALFSPGVTGWFLYVFLMPFWGLFPLALLGPSVGWAPFLLWVIGYPILRILTKRRVGLGKTSRWGRVFMPTSGSGWSTHGGFGGGGFSGGGGSFGGGGSSSSW